MPLSKNNHSEKARQRIVHLLYVFLSQKNKKTTRTLFAQLLKTNKISVNRWEYGKRNPTHDDIIDCCLAFPQYAQWIVFGGGIKPEPEDLKKFKKLTARRKLL